VPFTHRTETVSPHGYSLPIDKISIQDGLDKLTWAPRRCRSWFLSKMLYHKTAYTVNGRQAIRACVTYRAHALQTAQILTHLLCGSCCGYQQMQPPAQLWRLSPAFARLLIVLPPPWYNAVQRPSKRGSADDSAARLAAPPLAEYSARSTNKPILSYPNVPDHSMMVVSRIGYKHLPSLGAELAGQMESRTMHHPQRLDERSERGKVEERNRLWNPKHWCPSLRDFGATFTKVECIFIWSYFDQRRLREIEDLAGRASFSPKRDFHCLARPA
jgi:hypothetical protein